MGRIITSVTPVVPMNKFNVPLTQCWTASRRYASTANTVIKIGSSDSFTAITSIIIENLETSSGMTGNVWLGNVNVTRFFTEYVASAAAGNTDISFSTPKFDNSIPLSSTTRMDFGDDPLISTYINANLTLQLTSVGLSGVHVSASGFFFR